jgi:hypothetical protein
VIQLWVVTRWRRCALVVLLGLLLTARPAWAQFSLFQLPGKLGAFLDSQELQEPRRAPLTINPSLALTGEYNDNIFFDNDNRVSDFIIRFEPGLEIVAEGPTYRFGASYNFTAAVFASETQESHAFDHQNFSLDTLWRVDPHVTLTLTDTFILSTDTNLISSENVATGRDRGWTNTLAAGVAWDFAPLWTLRSGVSWTTERYQRDDLLDSDVYRVTVGVDRRLSPEVTGGADYEFGYFDLENEPQTTTHTPRLGIAWRATPTITLSLRAGPTFEVQEGGDTKVTPAVSASYRQRMPFGAVGLAYDRAVGTAGGLGGVTHNQLVWGFVDVTTLLRGLTLRLVPRYSTEKSSRDDSIDVRSFTASLQMQYRLTDWMSLIGGYQFFRQRSDSTLVTTTGTPLATDADQNRVFFGVQFGYPIRFD